MSSAYQTFFPRFLRLFQQDKIIEAYQLLSDAGVLHTENQLSSEDLEVFNRQEEVTLVRENLQNADKCLKMLSDYDSWTLVRDEDDIITWCQEADGDFFVRAEMTVHESVFPALALFSEVDLLTQS